MISTTRISSSARLDMYKALGPDGAEPWSGAHSFDSITLKQPQKKAPFKVGLFADPDVIRSSGTPDQYFSVCLNGAHV